MPNTAKIVKYHNDMASISLPGFSPTDLNCFSACLYVAKGKGTKPHVIYIDELMTLAGYAAKDKKRFMRYLDKLTDKILDLKYKEKDASGGFTKFNLFTKFKTIIDEETGREALLQAVSADLAYVLKVEPEYLPDGVKGLLSGGYTKYELDQHNALVSTYSKNAFRQLKRFERTGWWLVDVAEFRRLLDVPDSYRLSDLRRRVLGPIREELPQYFKNLKIEEKTGKGPEGRKTTLQLYFTFDKNLEKGVWYEDETKKALGDKYKCPICGDPLFEIIKKNGDVFYGHKDGWKTTAACHQTYGSLAEILGMNESTSEGTETRDASDERRPKKTGFSCKECGRPLYTLYNEKGEMFYGHIDGWKDDAVCKQTYGSVAEIRGFSETPTREDHQAAYDLIDKDEIEYAENRERIRKMTEGLFGTFETTKNED